MDLVEYAGAVLAGSTPTGGAPTGGAAVAAVAERAVTERAVAERAVAEGAVADGAVAEGAEPGAEAAGAAGGVNAAVLDSGDHDWFDVLGLLPAAMYRAAAPATDPGHRETLLALLESCARSGLASQRPDPQRAHISEARHIGTNMANFVRWVRLGANMSDNDS